MTRSNRKADFKTILSKLWHKLPKKRRLQYSYILLLMLVSSVADVISLGAVIPFLGVLIEPDKVLRLEIVSSFADWMGYSKGADLVLPITLTFCASALVAGFIRIFLLYGNSRISCLSGADLSIEVYRRTLYQPYSVHVSRNSSDVISGITKVDGAVIVISQCMTLISSLFSIFFITSSLFYIDSKVASIAILSFGLSYIAITFLARKKLLQNSKRISIERTKILKAKQEGLGGIRDILLDGTQSVYCDIYSKADTPLRQAIGNNIFLSGSPRHFMESFGMVMIAVLAYVLSFHEGGISTAIPALGALALGAQRLLPALQQGYGGWATIMGCYHSLVDLVDLLEQPLPNYLIQHEEIKSANFAESITLKNVSFSYDQSSSYVLKSINLRIEKGSRIGVVGTTGSGKSTLINIIMGLLEPTSGVLEIDGSRLASIGSVSWQRNIAHVPQNIYLSDCSFAENIAFGVPEEEIDMERVRKVAKQAQIHEYIESRSNGYLTHVGERGVRLSGGQKQRIGIARALYKEASVLVLDEATSALDNATEYNLMKSLETLDWDLTVIMIAHRLATMRSCERVIVLERGEIVADGTLKDLEERSEAFQRLASQESLEL